MKSTKVKSQLFKPIIFFSVILCIAMSVASLGQEKNKEKNPNYHYIAYREDDGTYYCFLCLCDFHYAVAVRERGSPKFIAEVEGKAGIGATKEEAKANLSKVKNKKDSSGKIIEVYFEQKESFKGVNVFYLDLSTDGLNTVHITYETAKAIKYIN